MITYGYAKDHYYTGDGTLMVRVRIPSIHGAYKQTDYKGQTIRNYTQDDKLPYYQSLQMSHIPNEGDVVVLLSTNDSRSNMIVIGTTGASYNSGKTNLEV